MPKLNMVVMHRLTQEEALNRIKTLLGEVKKEFADNISNLREEWNGNMGKFSFSVMGFSVSGTLAVKSSSVELSANLPFVAMLASGKIEKTKSTIMKRAEILLA